MTEQGRKQSETAAVENIHDRIDRLQREWNRPGFMRADAIEGEPISGDTALLAHELADLLTQRFRRVWVGPMNDGEIVFEWSDEAGGECSVIVQHLEASNPNARP